MKEDVDCRKIAHVSFAKWNFVSAKLWDAIASSAFSSYFARTLDQYVFVFCMLRFLLLCREEQAREIDGNALNVISLSDCECGHVCWQTTFARKEKLASIENKYDCQFITRFTILDVLSLD